MGIRETGENRDRKIIRFKKRRTKEI